MLWFVDLTFSYFRIFVFNRITFHVLCFVMEKPKFRGGGGATHNGKGKRCSKSLKKYLIDAGNLFGNCSQCLPSLFLPHSSAKGGEGLLHPLCEVQKRNRAENRNIQKGH